MNETGAGIMKKYLRNILFLLILFLSVQGYPQKAKAEEDLTIPEWTVDANLLENGDLRIVENIEFEFNDEFNGVFREIMLTKTSGATEIAVTEMVRDDALEYTQVKDADNGDSGVYLIKEKKDRIIIQIFSPSEDQQRIFQISYRIKNVATRYKDTGELYYKFLGDENETPIGKFIVNITLPHKDTNNKVKLYAHGPLNGKINKVRDTIYSLSVTDVPGNTFVEGRILFPKEYIPLTSNVQDIDNLMNIINEEEAYQSKRIEDLQRKEALRNILEKVSLLLSGFGAAIYILFLSLFRREKDIYQNQDFIGIPEDCTPAIAALLTSTYMSTNTIFATILDLYRKGYLRIHVSQGTASFEDKKQDFIIERVTEADKALLNHEQYFLHWLFHEIGDGSSVSTKDIENYSKHHNTKFMEMYNTWNKKVKEDAIQKGYYDKSKRKHGVFLMLLSILIFVTGIITVVYGSLYGLAGIFSAVVLFIYSLMLLYRLSDYGYNQYKKWVYFKKKMKKLDRKISMDDMRDELDSSLIYALSLNVIKKTDKSDYHKAYHYEEVYSYNGWIIWYLLFASNNNNSFRRSMDNAFHGTTPSSSGGSFSAGGGGGAGGGGAGGF